jgi:hypothetical protein
MPVIQIEGETRKYMFSVINAELDNMPDWGGIFIAVSTQNPFGIKMSDCLAIGSCLNFNKYKQHIFNSIRRPYTHLYLLPEFQLTHRQFALNDLIKMQAFADVDIAVLESVAKDEFSLPELDKIEFVNVKPARATARKR